MRCKNCGKENGQVKAGKMRAGSQKYKCKNCGKVYTPNPKERTYGEEKKAGNKTVYGSKQLKNCRKNIRNK